MESPRTGSSAELETSPFKTGLKIFGVLLLVATAIVAGVALQLGSQFYGGTANFLRQGAGLAPILNPRSYFPGRDRLVVLWLGLDRNIVRSRNPRINGMPTWKNARSDVMMIASLDLANHSVTILSIPRDTRVILPGRRYHSKINEAHSRGGIPYTREAVEEFLGIKIDHHVVIKQEAVEAVVDALGGLQVPVEKDMDYDDSWGQLHIHLKEGEQVLTGAQVAGYMRFRHDPEGDLGRIRRQQQVVQILAEAAKSPSVLLKAGQVIKAIRSHIQTDLEPEQQLALAHLFHRLQPSAVQTVMMPIIDTATLDGISYVLPDEERLRAAADWIANGNLDSMNQLIRVEVRNASGDPETYQRVYRFLRHAGFCAWRGGRARGEPEDLTRAVQYTPQRGAGRRVLDVLGLSGSVDKDEGRTTDVVLYVGKDLIDSVVALSAEDLPEQSDWRPPRRPRIARAPVEEPVQVEVREVGAPGEEPEASDPTVTIEGGEGAPAPPPPDAESQGGTKPGPDAPGEPGQGTGPKEGVGPKSQGPGDPPMP